jgi:diguanylate cyclase (GGDEF)-like protein
MSLLPRRRPVPHSVLVVDDDPTSRHTVARMLEILGHAVVEAADAATALERVLAGGPRIELVVTDVLMPGGGGDELAEQLWAVRPQLPVLLISGSAPADLPAPGDATGPSGFLLKPFDLPALARSLTDLGSLAKQRASRRAHDAGPARSGSRRWDRIRSQLPSGRTLSAAEWARRHRFVVAVLWAHVAILPVIGLLLMPGRPLHALSHGAVLVPAAVLAGRRGARPRLRGLAAALGLLTSSAVIVHLSGGLIEAHFHYFVVVALLSLYEDWTLFLAALLFVVLEHGVMSVVEPATVFAHGGNPWLWSGVHGAAISLMAGANIVAWRFNEDVRRTAARGQERLHHRALHDELTGLANRRLLLEQMERAAADPALRAQGAAIMRIDLDNFKLINDFYGNAAGNRLLIDVGARLRAQVRDTDLVARSGGDEFVLVVRSIADEAQARAAAEAVLDAFAEPFVIAGGARRISASIGVSLVLRGDASATEGLARADAALFSAKDDGRARVRLADHDVLQSAHRRTQVEDALATAEARDFDVFYQPIVDLRDGSLAAVEALLRWPHPQLGAVSPGEFIPLAESCGRILDLGRWVLERACVQAVRWQTRRGRPLKVLVNISASQITHPGFAATVLEVMTMAGVTGEHIALEITESAAVDRVAAADNIAALRHAGVELVLDDFGVGYSSLGALAGVGISTIKLDRSFVAEPPKPEHRAILAAVTELARGLAIPAVAEGIETRDQLDLVRAARFDLGQGYLFARPQPAGDLDDLVCRPHPFAALLRDPAHVAAA